MMKLYYAPAACSLASHIALEEAGAEYETERMDLQSGRQRSPEYLAINPKGRVPALRTDRGVLTESPVILGYVAESFPDAHLAPVDDSFAFGEVQAFNMHIASTVHPAYAHIFRPSRYGDEAAFSIMKAKALETLDEYFRAMDRRLDGRDWVHDAYTISDPYLMVMSRWVTRTEMELSAYPAVHAHLLRMQARPAVARVLRTEGIPPV